MYSRRRSLIEASGEGEILPVGGRIFYIHNDNGTTYKFYDRNMNLITDQTVSGLANAAYYSIKGHPTADKFYVSHLSRYTGGWCYGSYRPILSVNTIGSGKSNTALFLANIPSTITNSIFVMIRDFFNSGNYPSYDLGCFDWYIGSMAEINQQRLSGIYPENLFNRRYVNGVWSSNSTQYYAYAFSNSSGTWNEDSAGTSGGYSPIRSF